MYPSMSLHNVVLKIAPEYSIVGIRRSWFNEEGTCQLEN